LRTRRDPEAVPHSPQAAGRHRESRLRNPRHDGSSFIDIQDCRIDHTFQPGIGLWNSADIRVVGNEVTRANTQTKRLFGSRSQEAPHEAISIAGIDRFEAAWNRVHHCQKEGIDVKEISRNGVVHHNWVHNLDRQGLYADAWFGVLRDVRFLNNVVHDCEWGLVISAEGKDAELIGVEAEGNLIYRNRASGIYFGTWGGNGPRSRIVIRRNTLVGNGTRTHWAGPTGNIDLRATNARDVLVERNLIIAGGAYQMATGWTDVERAERRIVLRDNFFDSVTTPNLDGLEMGPYGRPVPTFGETPSSGEVRFEGDAFGDFSFSPESPAKPAGYGAHGLRPAINSPLKGFEPYRPDPRGLHPFLVRQMESVAP
ncbi:MAG: right-handed parallel beta-helix repeat-containing protein, partial [Fimbriimonadaceae bacterium]|nr:right-handed parallel beta-helix repeat-containing protein [Fimbriimonadaceae bacterium]